MAVFIGFTSKLPITDVCAPFFIVQDIRIKLRERLIIEMFKELKMVKTLEKAITCPQCRNKNTYLIKKESKDLEDIGFAWYGCRDCGDKFIRRK